MANTNGSSQSLKIGGLKDIPNQTVVFMEEHFTLIAGGHTGRILPPMLQYT
jgi:hypothetical protein